jgi:hypothetical protein
MPVRPALQWLCAAVIVASGAALVVDYGSSKDQAVHRRHPDEGNGSPSSSPPLRILEHISPNAASDPFGDAPAPIQVKATPPPVPPPPPPPAPQFTWRYLGQMNLPDGTHHVLLSRDNLTIEAEAGRPLDDEFIVEAVTAASVRVRHIFTGTEFVIELPEVVSGKSD